MSVIRLPSDQDASGRSFGPEEIAALTAVIDERCAHGDQGLADQAPRSGTRRRLLGVEHAIACASGTAAVHAAVAALDPEPGDEIVTTSITDMGALTPILYQGAIPVFADVDPVTGNVTAETIAARLTPRTKAIVVTHLFGNPCEMDAILALAAAHGLPVIEDCAQAFLGSQQGPAHGHDRRDRLLQPAAGQAHHHRRGRPRRHQRRATWPAACACSSTRRGATASRSPTTTSSRSTTA